jgi:Na+/H+ antiporter NhaC
MDSQHRCVLVYRGLHGLDDSAEFQPVYATLDMIEARIFVQISVASNIQIIFTMMAIGGFIGLLGVSGGSRAFARNMTGFMTSGARAQVATWISGLMIFFTDSGNALTIGPLFRPICTELKICREKLAYILDSTASPVCILMPFIGWGAYIIGLIEQSYADAGLTEPALNVLPHVMPYQFYAIFTLAAVPFFILCGRDFGPMTLAQKRYEFFLKQVSESDENLEIEAGCEASESLETPMALFAVPLTILLGLIGLDWCIADVLCQPRRHEQHPCSLDYDDRVCSCLCGERRVNVSLPESGCGRVAEQFY